MTAPLVVDLNPRRWTACAACGDETPVECGLPKNDAGDFVNNDYAGEWGGVPACRRCHDFHAKYGARALDDFVAALLADRRTRIDIHYAAAH